MQFKFPKDSKIFRILDSITGSFPYVYTDEESLLLFM